MARAKTRGPQLDRTMLAGLRDDDGSVLRAIHGLEGLCGATIDDARLGLLAPVLAAHQGVMVT
ncbi:hypothetical protein E3T28_14735 [Cryobacterium sinapicolor]|uniref:Uncharacterized protein n=1 Tax=Cryobacterium sinapicolor TaxID=1259236 RepID=A0ABY2IWR5_9MICO|nr:hypothetical protein [Cryobacterium sinapicolor]TFC94557.1 hypothetical protein E3T28_14735 [Cryobacterium sinapicolor]